MRAPKLAVDCFGPSSCKQPLPRLGTKDLKGREAAVRCKLHQWQLCAPNPALETSITIFCEQTSQTYFHCRSPTLLLSSQKDKKVAEYYSAEAGLPRSYRGLILHCRYHKLGYSRKALPQNQAQDAVCAERCTSTPRPAS